MEKIKSDKIKETIRSIAFDLYWLGMGFLLVSFCELSYDPLEWYLKTRILFAVYSLIVILISSNTNFLFEDDEVENEEEIIPDEYVISKKEMIELVRFARDREQTGELISEDTVDEWFKKNPPTE